MAHDFNNLLTVIIGSLGLLKKRLPGDQRTADLLQNALEAAQRGANLTQRMLRPQATSRSAALRDPRPVARDDRPADPFPGTERIDRDALSLDLDLGLTDANQLELSIINLATNARDAMPNGGRIVFPRATSGCRRTIPIASHRATISA